MGQGIPQYWVYFFLFAQTDNGILSKGIGNEDKFLYDYFPPNFMWGVGSSSFQSEGAPYADGKGLTNWDYLGHNGTFDGVCNFDDCAKVDDAPDSYHKFEEDSTLVKNVGVGLSIKELAHFFRMSISWARIVPTGRVRDGVNQAGIDYYNRVINSLVVRGIEPFVTILHHDLPLPLYWESGLRNSNFIQHFRDYAKICFEEFGDRVRYWTTLNEPQLLCFPTFRVGENQSIEAEPVKIYKCVHNIIKAHAITWRLYDEVFRLRQRGLVTIVILGIWPTPLDPTNPTHVKLTEIAMQFHFGWIVNPLLRGEYPPIMRKMVDKNSLNEGRKVSRLPTFSPKWTKIINGTLDFIGLNHYFSNYVSPGRTNFALLTNDAGIHVAPDNPTWPQTAKNWPVVPWAMRKILNWIHTEYGGGVPIYITENGYSDFSTGSPTTDPKRIKYFKTYINQVLKAIRIDGVDVRAYTAWSLLDLFERGYKIRFGICHVNHTDPNRIRTPKDSFYYLKQLFADNGFPSPFPN